MTATDGGGPGPEEARATRRRTLLAAAAFVVAGGTAVVLLSGGERERAGDMVPGPGATTTTAPDGDGATTVPGADQPTTTAPGSTTASTTATTAPVPATRPPLLAAVTVDGRLVVLDSATGAEVRELARHPANPGGEGPPVTIDAVSVTPDRSTVYYSTCCDPTPGSTWAVPLTGGEPVRLLDGREPAVSPDGATVAAANHALGIALYSTETERTRTIQPPGGGTADAQDRLDVGSIAWSPDARTLAIERVDIGGDREPVNPRILLVAATAATLDEAREVPGPWRSPVFGARSLAILVSADDARIVAVDLRELTAAPGRPGTDYPELTGDVTPVALSGDPSGGWVVVTTESGRLFAISPDDDVTAIPGAGRYVAADW